LTSKTNHAWLHGHLAKNQLSNNDLFLVAVPSNHIFYIN
jgi:hypothetical protein